MLKIKPTTSSEPAPAGAHLARLINLVGLGHQATLYGVKPQVMLTFELVNEKMTDGRPYVISKTYTASLSKKSSLRRDLETWLGRDLGDEEFDLTSLLGREGLVSVRHTEKEARVYANVGAIAAVPKGLPVPAAANPLLSYDADAHDDQAFAALPSWVQKRVLAAVVPEPPSPPVSGSTGGIPGAFDDLLPNHF